jgi:hypothetical protein
VDRPGQYPAREGRRGEGARLAFVDRHVRQL